jgi:hypothetical protein
MQHELVMVEEQVGFGSTHGPASIFANAPSPVSAPWVVSSIDRERRGWDRDARGQALMGKVESAQCCVDRGQLTDDVWAATDSAGRAALAPRQRTLR